MFIFPMHKKGSTTPRYFSGAVYTTGPNGERVLVGVDYEADSVAEVIRLAVLNARVKHMRNFLTRKLSLRCACDE